MAAGKPVRPSRYLAIVAAAIVALYLAVIFGKPHSPKLGLDLRGGTSVILTAHPTASGKITKSSLNQAVNIIRQRVNGLGVSAAQVSTQGSDNIVVEVPGRGRDQVVRLVGQTAELRFRQVLAETNGGPTAPVTATPSASPTARLSASPSATARPKATTTRKRALSAILLAASASPSPSPKPGSSANPTPAPGVSKPPVPTAGIVSGTVVPSPSVGQLYLSQLDCTNPANRAGAGGEQPSAYIVACSQDGLVKYLLGPAKVLGSQVSSADYSLQQNSTSWQVNLSFNGRGTKAFGDLTQVAYQAYQQNPQNPQAQIAIVLDGVVVSAPAIDQGPIYGGQAQITGNFSQTAAKNLADVLKYGQLPLRFTISSAQTVSATLGSDQLRGGLIAGAIGLGLVILYSLLYYRGLGLVTIASLVLSGVILYAATTLLGRALGYTLTLAGIAGFIVAVGITADSFVVYFERMRDEIREGRTLRSAVDRAWPRARRTILSADTVSFLAAAVLYLVSIGDVRGFAFTLGMSTLSDLFIVFLFTKPILNVLSRTRLYGSGGAFSGLSTARMRGSGVTEPEPAGGGA